MEKYIKKKKNNQPRYWNLTIKSFLSTLGRKIITNTSRTRTNSYTNILNVIQMYHGG